MSKNIVLIGMPGCGKSTIGLELSKRLSMDFIDIDSYIEKNENMTISGMFEVSEEYFREIESKYVEKLSGLNSTVISAGGGAVKKDRNMQLLKVNSVIIYINRKTDDIIKDIDVDIRPLLKDNKERLYELYPKRHPLYQRYCDIEILNDSDVLSVTEKICGILDTMNR